MRENAASGTPTRGGDKHIFVESLGRQLEGCQVLLALIGPHWLTAKDARGRRRIDDENDFVRIEVRTALDRGIRVVPVLIDGAPMPVTEELPADLQRLVRLQALELDFKRFDQDVGRLVDVLRKLLTADHAKLSPGIGFGRSGCMPQPLKP